MLNEYANVFRISSLFYSLFILFIILVLHHPSHLHFSLEAENPPVPHHRLLLSFQSCLVYGLGLDRTYFQFLFLLSFVFTIFSFNIKLVNSSVLARFFNISHFVTRAHCENGRSSDFFSSWQTHYSSPKCCGTFNVGI